MIIKPYRPKNFGKEYCNLIGDHQYSMFLAVALGVKTSYDDWVPMNRYDGFIEACIKYGLVVEPDIIFTETKEKKKDITGGKLLTTTFRSGKRFSKDETEGQVHVFVAKTKETALNAKKSGWYHVVINNRIINKPFIDHLSFGKYLGFPECCVDFFRRFNNWSLFSHPYETLKNTATVKGKAIGSYHCNNILMDRSYFFIHHLPCSYRCRNTIRLAKRVEQKIKEVEPDYADKTAELLKKPLLVFGEKNYVIFEGDLLKKKQCNVIRYNDCQYLENYARVEESVDFFDSIKAGNELIVEKKQLTIKDNNSTIKTVKKKQGWFAIDFD